MLCLRKRFLRYNGPKVGVYNSTDDLHGFRMKRMSFGWFAYTVGQIRLRSAFALSSASVLYLVSYTDMICTTSGGVSRRRHGLMQSRQISQYLPNRLPKPILSSYLSCIELTALEWLTCLVIESVFHRTAPRRDTGQTKERGRDEQYTLRMCTRSTPPTSWVGRHSCLRRMRICISST